MRLLDKVDKLITKTNDQKDAIMGACFDLFLQLEKDRELLRAEIERIVKEDTIDPLSKGEYKRKLEVLINLEQDNRRLIKIWKKRLEKDRAKIQKDRITARRYYNRDIVNGPSFNKVV